MSSRLFQNIREKRGLAYAVFSGLTAYRDAGALTHLRRLRQRERRRGHRLVVAEMRGSEARADHRRRTAPRQGSPQGQPDARPREHVEPHVAPGAPGDLLRSARSRSTRRSPASSGDGRGRAARRRATCSPTARSAVTVLGPTPNGLSAARRIDWICAMIARYTHPKWVASGATSAATRPGSRSRSPPPKRWPTPASCPREAAREHPRQGRLRHRAHRRDRKDDAARRDRVHDRRRRERRAVARAGCTSA